MINTFYDPNNDAFNRFLTRAILSKLRGRVQMLIGSRLEISNWEQIKVVLNNFGDQRDVRCLEQDLSQLKTNKN